MGAPAVAELSLEPRAPDWLAEFDWFVDSLRNVHGFRIGVGEQLRAMRLVHRLLARGVALDDPEIAAGWLAPVLVTSAAEQQRFRSLFVDFATVSPVPRRDGAGTRPVVPPPPWWRRADALLIALGGVTLLVLLALVLWAWWRGEFVLGGLATPGVVDPVLESSLPEALGRILGATPSMLSRAVLLVLPLIPAAGLILWRRRRSSVLQRGAAPRDVRAQRLDFDLAATPLFAQPWLPAALQALRRHRRVPAQDFDAEATLRATLAAGGRVEPRRGTRRLLVEYVLLVERRTALDHRARIADLVADRLGREQVRFARYDFHRAPVTLRRASDEGGVGEIVELADLVARHQGQVAIVVADAATLVDESGRLAAWIDELSSLAPLTLLTPDPPSRWGERERRLVDHGIVLLPAASTGLRVLGEMIRGGGGFAPPSLGGEPDAIGPGLDLEDPRWLLDAPPPVEEIAALVAEIDARLPPAARELLACLAALPVVDPALTLYLGARLSTARGDMLLDEIGLGALSGLPWMRRSRMPDWLRAALVARLSDRRLAELQLEFQSLLQRRTSRPDGKLTLEIALKPGAEWLDSLRRLIRGDPSSPLRDVIFLSVMRGERPPPLAVAGTSDIARLLRRGLDREERVALALAGAMGVIGALFPVTTVQAIAFAYDAMAGNVAHRLSQRWIAPLVAAFETPLTNFAAAVALIAIACWSLRAWLAATGRRDGRLDGVLATTMGPLAAAVAVNFVVVSIGSDDVTTSARLRYGALAMATSVLFILLFGRPWTQAARRLEIRSLAAVFTAPGPAMGVAWVAIAWMGSVVMFSPPLSLTRGLDYFLPPAAELSVPALRSFVGSAMFWGIVAVLAAAPLLTRVEGLTRADVCRIGGGFLLGTGFGIATAFWVSGSIGVPLTSLPRVFGYAGLAHGLRSCGAPVAAHRIQLLLLAAIPIELGLYLGGSALLPGVNGTVLVGAASMLPFADAIAFGCVVAGLGGTRRLTVAVAALALLTVPVLLVAVAFFFTEATAWVEKSLGVPMVLDTGLTWFNAVLLLSAAPVVPSAWLLLRRHLVRSGIAVAAPSAAVAPAARLVPLVVAACWLMGLRLGLNPGPWQPLLLVAALWFAQRAPERAERLVLLAGLPMLVTIQVGGFGTSGHPVMVAAAWMVARLATRPELLDDVMETRRLALREWAVALALLCFVTLGFRPTAESIVSLRMSGEPYLYLALLLVGLSRLAPQRVFAAVAGAAIPLTALLLLRGDHVSVDLGAFFAGLGVLDGPVLLVSGTGALLCGCWMRREIEAGREGEVASGTFAAVALLAQAVAAAALPFSAAWTALLGPSLDLVLVAPLVANFLAFAVGFVRGRFGVGQTIAIGIAAAIAGLFVTGEAREIMTIVVRAVVASVFAYAGDALRTALVARGALRERARAHAVPEAAA